MGTEYLYGAYGHLKKSIAQSAVQGGTTPVYIGTLPINLVRGWKELDLVNKPIKVTSMMQAQRTVGYSPRWENFTLCEAIAAHFNNSIGNIGPVYLINVLDPKLHKKDTATATTITTFAGSGSLKTDTIILDTLTVTADSKTLVEGEDYTLDYNYNNSTLTISSPDDDHPLASSLSLSYEEVDDSKVDADTIIGSVTLDGEYKGLQSIACLYPEDFAIANLLAAPGWSHNPEVYRALLSAASKINGHWDAFVVADLPLVDGSVAVDTIAKAVKWKTDHGYDSEHSKVCWPMAIAGDDSKYHLSTMAVVELMRADASHKDIPMETCGNKPIPVVRQYFGPNAVNQGFDKTQGRELTSHGITTCVPWAGSVVLWGDHTAAYTFGKDIDPRGIFDVSMRMLKHITNSFQQEWSPAIDQPMTRHLKDRILNREQAKLDAMAAMGALIGNPEVLFLESENSTTDMMNGDFRWDIAVTPTPPLKSATVYVAYTDAGFASYY